MIPERSPGFGLPHLCIASSPYLICARLASFVHRLCCSCSGGGVERRMPPPTSLVPQCSPLVVISRHGDLTGGFILSSGSERVALI